MDLPLIPVAPAPPNAAASPAAAAPGNPATPEAGAQIAPDFAALLAAGIALPAAGEEAGDLAGLIAMGTVLSDTESAPAGAEPLDPTLGLVLAAIALPGAAPAAAATAAHDAAQAFGLPASATAEPASSLPAAAQPGRAAAPDLPLALARQEPDAGLISPAVSADGATGTAIPPPLGETAAARASLPASVHAPAVAGELRAAVGADGWDAQLGRTVLWMAGERFQVAEVRLNPPNLGPLEIVLRLGGDDGSQASVSFSSPHADVRAALETALPRLRDMLASSGITLGEAHVNAESFRDANGTHHSGPNGGADADATAAVLNLSPTRTGAGLVDIFA